ncbi:hypothetical protein REPUB_Repub16aG0080600 [Reevesia pubescens]
MAVTIFVNLPEQVRWRWLERIFGRFGFAVDVFIPRKRSLRGKRFGFVRYGSIADARKAIWNLNGVWLLDAKIGVYFAKFNPRSAYWKKKDSKGGSSGVVADREDSLQNKGNDVEISSGSGSKSEKTYLSSVC